MEKGDVFLTPLTVPERWFGEVDFFLMMVTTAVYDAIMFLAVCVCGPFQKAYLVLPSPPRRLLGIGCTEQTDSMPVFRAQELCECHSRCAGRPGRPVPSLMVRTVSVDVTEATLKQRSFDAALSFSGAGLNGGIKVLVAATSHHRLRLFLAGPLPLLLLLLLSSSQVLLLLQMLLHVLRDHVKDC